MLGIFNDKHLRKWADPVKSLRDGTHLTAGATTVIVHRP